MNDTEAATLDPPGTIAVIGVGPLGMEAALYGRYLGYDVTLIEGDSNFEQLINEDDADAPIPIRPDRCASPLARSALAAQDGQTVPTRSPMTIGEWVEQIWRPLAETDLLRGRLRQKVSPIGIEFAPVEASDETDREESEEIPPDFRLTLSDGEPLICEAVIDTSQVPVPCSFPLPADYHFRVQGEGSDAESKFWNGLKQIVAIYAALGGRAELDLYHPVRG